MLDTVSRNFKEPEEILTLYINRQNAMGEDFLRMRQMYSIMNYEIYLPLPELTEDEKPAVANLANQGMAQLARRIASVDASHYFPSLDPGHKHADEDARTRNRLMASWHHENKLRLQLGKRARQFLAYATAPCLIKPDPKNRIPKWCTYEALDTFPGNHDFHDPQPTDCIFVTRYTYADLLKLYPEAALRINKRNGWDPSNPDPDAIFECLYYVDDYEYSMTLIGHNDEDIYQPTAPPATNMAITLTQVRNLTGECTASIPGSINLDKQLGHFDGIIGMYQAQAALMAITIVAQRRAVWPREWAVSNPNEQVEVTTQPDPARGIPGEIKGGKIETQTMDPSFHAGEVMDRLEHAQRMTASLPAEFGGMSPTNIRTGVRGMNVMSSTIDFTISEAQDVFTASQYFENRMAIAVDKAFFPESKTVYLVTRSFAGSLDYTPSKLWVTDKHIVEYPIAGVDLQNLPIEGGQRVQMQTMSRKRFMEIDPVIPDAEAEMTRIVREAIQTAHLSSIQALAANPEGPWQPADLAYLDSLVAQGMELYEAVMKVNEAAQARQAPTGTPTLDQQQPGLSLPGQGAEAQPATGQEQPSLEDFTSLLGQLGTVQQAQRYRG